MLSYNYSYSMLKYFRLSKTLTQSRPFSVSVLSLDTQVQPCKVQMQINCIKAFGPNQSVKRMSTEGKSSTLCRLDSRSLVQLSGIDTMNFMQGLVTNDVQYLEKITPSTQYCMMLNVQGRVLYDLFMYNVSSNDKTTILIDVDKSGKEDFVKLLKRYKLRKKLSIDDVSEQYNVWYQFNTEMCEDSQEPMTFHDPRVQQLGCRFITDQGANATSKSTNAEVCDADVYTAWRYRWGIPEGVVDLPPGNCLPLESNLALMNGVNFQKGCYVGQELTARTYHTGVIRKRLLPLQLEEEAEIEADTTITTKDKGKNAGKFRNAIGKSGLGLLRLAHVNEELVVVAKDGRSVNVRARVPDWWPAGLV